MVLTTSAHVYYILQQQQPPPTLFLFVFFVWQEDVLVGYDAHWTAKSNTLKGSLTRITPLVKMP